MQDTARARANALLSVKEIKMPVHKSYKDGKMVGWRYGRTGKVYRSKKDAIAQEVAINIARGRIKVK